MEIGLITMMMATQIALIRDPIFGTESGLTFARDLEWSNRSGAFDRTERAAFIVSDGKGGLVCIAWRATQQHEQATFTGKIPPGTIAIIHTHPLNAPWPSLQDEMEARRLGIPIYALTPRSVSRVTPSQQPVMVHHGKWLDPAPAGHPCRHN